MQIESANNIQMKLNQVKVDYPRVPNQYQAADPFDVETPFDLNQTMDFIGRDLFAYVTEIKDPEVSAILCTVAQEKVRQCFGVIDQLVKLAWVASNTMPDFATTFKAAYQTVDTPARKDLSLAYAKSASSEIKLFTDFVQKLGSYKQSKDKVEGEFHAELKLANNLTIQSIAEQIQELVDYNQHTIRRKNFKRRAIPPPSVQPLSECYRKKEYDYIHKEKVNCVDICPFSRLLASGSSDGTIKFVDLDDLTIFSELTIQEPGKKGIFSLCIDDKHNLAYVNEDNLLRIMSLSTNHCIFKHQGLPLQELTDEIPDQAVQFTTDYRHLVFRNGARQIIFVLMSGLRVEKKLTTEDKIRDFSISPACDYLATASYEALQTEVYETTGGQLVSRLKFDGPIFTVQWAPNGVHAVYGGGNGKVYLVEFAKFHDKSLRVIHTFEGLFSISSNVAAVSVSHDSQYAAVGARNGDYRVKVINLWERCEQFALPADLHTFNVQGVRLSKNGKILATCSEDTTVKALLLR